MKGEVIAVLFGCLSAAAAAAAATQATELEPNDPCSFAQDLGPASLPLGVTGALDALRPDGDVDFVRLEAAPGAGIEAVMEGQSAGKGTLHDPFLGLFDSSCALIKLNDDSGSPSSRLLGTVPNDGVFILAATSCCDHAFEGQVGVGGSYQLTIRTVELIGFIRGRVVDSVSGAPLGSQVFPFARVDLYRCAGAVCSDRVETGFPESDGVFEFPGNPAETPLLRGTYQLRFFASLYTDKETPPFEVLGMQELDLGDVPLVATPTIGSVRGQVRDAITGIPLTGDVAPFTTVELRRCEPGGCFDFAGIERTDSQGSYAFETFGGIPIPTGTFQVTAEAIEYFPATSSTFSVSEGQHVVLNDLLLEPYPIGFSEVRPCGNLPPEGGVCEFSVRIVNRIDEPVDGSAWSVAESFSTGSLVGTTRFQAGPRRTMTLGASASRVVRFGIPVPSTVRDGAVLCSEIFFARGRADVFDTLGHRNLFCIQKGVPGFRLLSKEETTELMLEKRRARPRLK
jgi:hypothetical protein